MRATFSIDEQTEAALRRASESLGTSKSAVVRQAVIEFETRCDRLTEGERREKLAVIERLRAEPESRTSEEVARELAEIRRARRSGWREDS